ncbi:actin-binding LIM protein 1 [Trichonephila inaurata madagascariensis]|uniref:Actin-binding LIM protein 1 n=1 Tax=Trichonephila inaurata madagascariensis TaxID=2747483 RepID=A0A8X7CMB4_9ARAC|nr:actin-binding LIM protein 1 [Trichonephila inaurata madagascariensis]
MGKVLCEVCKKKCSGNALRVQDRYFHLDCFKCAECSSSLAQGGFFVNGGLYYCSKDYQKLFGTRCAECGDYVEGEVVTALGNTYHQKCFVCASCRQPFPSGEKVTYTGKDVLCTKCIQIPIVSSESPVQESQVKNGPVHKICAGCNEELKEGQALIALEKEWHIWCFKCTACEAVLHGEYMDKRPIIQNNKFLYIKWSWSIVENISQSKTKSSLSYNCNSKLTCTAGDNHHFHPTCARCSKCGDPFGDGEEMYLQGGAIWHPRCGPSPDGKMDDDYLDDHKTNGIMDGHYPPYSPSLSSSRSTSPYSSLTRQYGRTSPGMFLDKDPLITDLSRVYTLSYLTAEPTQGYLRRPIHPHPPKSPQFHRPPDGSGRRRVPISRPSSKQGMQALVDTIQSTTPRPRSPHMNNEEPINLAHYPDATKPPPNSVPPIERDDFPAPPFPYTDPERRRRWSGSSKDFEVDDDEEKQEDPQLKKEEEELSKIATGIGKVFLKNVQEREKIKAWKRANLDPRNASRTPSANKEPPSRLRYYSSIHASPSRDIDRPRPWEDDDFDRSSGYRSSLRSTGNTPCYNVVSSLRPIPKPGYGFSTKSATLPAAGREGGMGYMTSDLAFVKINPTQSSEFGSGKSDLSPTPEQGKDIVNHSASTTFRSTPYSEGFTFRHASYSPHLRRSMPNVNLHMSKEPPKLYPYHLLVTGNYRLPPDIDRCHLERHLSNEEFQAIFHVSRLEFYRLPEWRRNDLKKRAKLF